MKNILQGFWQYFVNIICSVLVEIWQDLAFAWQNTPCTVCHHAMACIPHWCCSTLLLDGATPYFIKMV